MGGQCSLVFFLAGRPAWASMLGEVARRLFGRERISESLSFQHIEWMCCGEEIETMILCVSGDDSSRAALDFDDIGVGHRFSFY
jgi:hypothetical protein